VSRDWGDSASIVERVLLQSPREHPSPIWNLTVHDVAASQPAPCGLPPASASRASLAGAVLVRGADSELLGIAVPTTASATSAGLGDTVWGDASGAECRRKQRVSPGRLPAWCCRGPSLADRGGSDARSGDLGGGCWRDGTGTLPPPRPLPLPSGGCLVARCTEAARSPAQRPAAGHAAPLRPWGIFEWEVVVAVLVAEVLPVVPAVAAVPEVPAITAAPGTATGCWTTVR